MDPKKELMYWVGFMRDHAVFQVNALAPGEQMYIDSSTYYVNFFEHMLKEIEKTENPKMVHPTLLQGLLTFIEYKKVLLKGLLSCKLLMNLPPSAINHQLNEAVEFKIVLTTPPPQYFNKAARAAILADRFKYWLGDSVGHASVLADFIEPIEFNLVDEANAFKDAFAKLVPKSTELQVMLTHTGLDDGALKSLSEEVIQLMTDFICYCGKVRDLRCQCKAMALGTFIPLIPDHFIREHQYFIEKINEFLC